MKLLFTSLLMSFFINSNVIAKTQYYRIHGKRIEFNFPASNKSWRDQLQGAYCRNKVRNEISSSEDLLERVNSVECLFLSEEDGKNFDIKKSYDPSNNHLTIPFIVINGTGTYPKLDDIINYVEKDLYRDHEKEEDEETKAAGPVLTVQEIEYTSTDYEGFSISHPVENKEWSDPLMGAYCRNILRKNMTENEQFSKNIKKIRCLLVNNPKLMPVKESFSKDDEVVIPFAVINDRLVLDEVFARLEYALSMITGEDHSEVESKEVAVDISLESRLRSFVAEFPKEYEDMLGGLPWIPENPKLRESFKIFIMKIKKDPDANGLSIGSLTNTFRYFEQNRYGLRDKTWLKKARDYGNNPDSYNWKGITNKKYIVIVNYTLARSHERFFLLNLEKNTIVSTYTAHGAGSNTNGRRSKTPGKFSNILHSNSTSRGFYLSGEAYCSSKKYFGPCRHKFKGNDGKTIRINAVRLDGLEKTNWRARMRGVVYHGAKYVYSCGSNVGNSAGCPATPISKFDEYHSKVDQGTLFYHYTSYEWKDYLKSRSWKF